MIQMQDVTVFDMPVENVVYEHNVEFQNSPYSSYTLAYNVSNPQKVEIIPAENKVISPVSQYLIEKLNKGTVDEQERCLSYINKNLDTKSSAQYLDEELTKTLFALVDKDISNLKDITSKQKKLRLKQQDGKKLTDSEYKIAFTFSEKEKAEYNKVEAVYVIARIQNVLYKALKKRTGLQPKLSDMPAVSGLVNEIKNNPSENVRSASVAALAAMYQPAFKDDLLYLLSDLNKNANSEYMKKQTVQAIKYIQSKK